MGLFQVACLGLLAAVARGQELQNCSADTTILTVSSTEDAAALATSLECANGDFSVQWAGEVVVDETIRVINGTSLNITGAGPGASADGQGVSRLFVVLGGSRLHLSRMTLAHGNALSDGGAVYAESSSLSLEGNTSFVSNLAGDDGGAIFAFGSTVSWDGDGIVFNNNSAGYDGGAMYLEYSTLHGIGDGTRFSTNSAGEDGGAIYANISTVSLDGDGAELSSNYAHFRGGAICSYNSSVSWDGDGANFSMNHADIYGGAIYSQHSNVSWDGDGAGFSNNFANLNGGAIYAQDANLSWAGDGAKFSSNSAAVDGGAIRLSSSAMFWDGDGAEFSSNSAGLEGGAVDVHNALTSQYGESTKSSNYDAGVGSGGAIDVTNARVSWDGADAAFNDNYADADGGAMRLHDSTLSWVGDGTEFSNNHADAGSGGAIYAADLSAVSWDGRASFSSNDAGYGGGAVALVDFGHDESTFSDALFVENSSGNGGAFYIYNAGEGFNFIDVSFEWNSASGAGGAIAVYAGTDHEPVTFSGCNFSDNTAIGAGGAVETLSGQQEFISCNYEGNSADVGGALRLGGDALVQDCSFTSNSASTRGLAVAVVGSANISGSSFDANELYCAVDSYRKDSKQEGGTTRFEAVCLDCPSWDECPGCSILRANVTPVCVAPLDHTTAEEAGVTLETLNITRGYWRATNTSSSILACSNAAACSGGQTGAEDFCSAGYTGPYCAVCEADYAPSLGHTCRRCSSSTRQRLMVATILAAIASAFMFAIVCKFLLSTELEDRNLGEFHRRVLRAVPVQALKIIVVVWQILTQFADAASVTLPGVYQDFLSAIAIVNFDLGSALAAGCLWSGMDFYDRLLISTLGPLVVTGFLAMTYRIAMCKNGAAGNIAALREKIRHKHLTALLLWTFLVYSSVSSMVFQTFACETLDDGIEYLRADYSVHCTDAKHVAFEVYAGIMVLIYPVGIPLLYAVLLYQRRDVLSDAGSDKTAAQPISSLWEPYRPERFYYEVVECGRRIMLTGVVVFIFPNDAAQIAITILIAFVFFAVFEVLSPYTSESDMWLSRGGHVIVFLSMFDMLLLKVDVSSESDQSQDIFAGVLVAGHVLMLLAIIIEVIGICFASRKKLVVERVGSSPSRPAESKPRAESEDDVPVFQSVPACWRLFIRQGSVSEASGPSRSVCGTVLTACRPESC